MAVGEASSVLCPVDPAPTAFFSPFCTLQINCVTFPHPDTMPEQQLLKPTEWSYCDYFWVGAASGSLHCDPQQEHTSRRAKAGRAFLSEASRCGAESGISDRTFLF